MLKTVKGKVIAGTVAIGLLSGVGVALGATDAGTHLKNWYDAQFTKSSNQITEAVANYGEGKVDGLLTEYNGLKEDASNKIGERGEFVTAATNKGIEASARNHIDSIKEQKAHIESYLSSQFKSLKDFAAGLINETGQKALEYANEDLKKHANAAGSEAQKKMIEDVKATTENAVNDLEETIKYAKEDLQAQLDKNTDLTIEEIKALIDAKIDELRTKITQLNNNLIAEQDKIITMVGKRLLLEAQAELDAIVEGINK